METFEHAWLRFELAATAKEWQEDKQLRTLPTLLRGKLVEYFVELGSEEKSSLEGVKAVLTKEAGLKKDPLVAAKHFSSREQGEKESVRDYATQLRKAFAEAYPKEVSAVLAVTEIHDRTSCINHTSNVTKRQAINNGASY